MYIFLPFTVVGMIDACDIFQFFGLGVFQRTFPVSQSTPIMRTSPPQGARTAVVPSMIGHWAVYPSGTVVPYSFTRSMPHLRSPVSVATHMTWHLGPIVTMYLSLTAGTVRLNAWKFTIFILYDRRQI